NVDFFFFFFFSSRRRHTRFDCDWSSDVCSSDLLRDEVVLGAARPRGRRLGMVGLGKMPFQIVQQLMLGAALEHLCDKRAARGQRSEERRVGKEGRTGWTAQYSKRKSGLVTNM